MSTSPGSDRHLGDLVVDLADGRLAGADPALALAHLDTCAGCRAELVEAVVAAAALREFADAPPPAAADPAPPPLARGPHAARTGQPAGTSRRTVALAAAVALVAGVGLAGAGAALHDRRRAASSAQSAPVAVTVLLRSGAGERGAAVLTSAGAARRMTVTAGGIDVRAGAVLVVWLSGRAAAPLRVGTLDARGRGSFAMSAATAARFAQVVLTEQPSASTTVMDATAVVASAQL